MCCTSIRKKKNFLFSLVSAFSQKTKTYKMGLGVCVYVCTCACVCVCVCVYLCKILVPLTISTSIIPLIRNFGYIIQGSSLKPNGAHGVSLLPRPCWISPILAAFMRAHGLAVCTPRYCTGHQHEQTIDSTVKHFRV